MEALCHYAEASCIIWDNVSVAEIDNQSLWQLATLGIACVSNHRRHADETLSSVVKFVAENYPDVEILRSETEVFPAL